MKLKKMTGLIAKACRSFIAVIFAIGLVLSPATRAMALSSTADAPTAGELARERFKEQAEAVLGESKTSHTQADGGQDNSGFNAVTDRVEETADKAQNRAKRGLERTREAVENTADDARTKVDDLTDSVKDLFD